MYHKGCYEDKFDTSIPRKLRDHNILCDNCKNNIYTCRVCGRNTELKVSSKHNQPSILQCCVPECNVYYHKKCVRRFPKTIYNSRTNTFKCPLHYCKKCSSKQKPLITCINCPNAYHYGCVMDSDGLKISPHRILCYKHKVPEGVVKYKKPPSIYIYIYISINFSIYYLSIYLYIYIYLLYILFIHYLF